VNRRASISTFVATLTALVGDLSTVAGKRHHQHHGNRHNPRKRLRKACRKTCKRVQHDCLFNCHALGYDDDICQPRCTIAKQSCKRGCR
jgi:hypothetical protein